MSDIRLTDVDIEKMTRETGINSQIIEGVFSIQEEVKKEDFSIGIKKLCYAWNRKITKDVALMKFNKFSDDEIENISTVEQAKNVCFNSLNGSVTKDFALMKWIEFSQTVEELIEAYENTSVRSVVECFAILELAKFFQNKET